MSNTLNPKSSEVTIKKNTIQRTWIANDITNNFWLVAKSGYSNSVDSKTPRDKLEKISFEKEICPGGYLTDSLFSNLLIDLKQCLINIFENGSTQKPYRLRGICNNIIYLIISVNEHRSEYGLPPILAFNQITEDDIFDFIKSFAIKPELINSVLSELSSLQGKPKKQDWLNIKNKYFIRTKTFSILKSRITSSKSSKLYKSSKSEKKRFDDANISRDICDFHAPNKKTVMKNVIDI